MVRMTFAVLGFAVAALIVGFVSWGFYQTYEVRRWDAKIDALCATNEGRDVAPRVYETAMAPETKEYFAGLAPLRSLFIPERSEGSPVGAQYPYVIETRVVDVLREGHPSVVKFASRIVRVSDNKVLGERFGYQRAGGGVPGFDPGEIRTCPALKDNDRLDVMVFVNHPYRKEVGQR